MLNANGLICPLDQTPLTLDGRSLQCSSGHSFDVAKQGYCHLLPVQNKRSKDPGDSKAMVQARAELFDSGAYLPVAEFMLQQVLPLLKADQENRIVDAGCGEGYYLSLLESACQEQKLATRLIGFDISKWALQRATRRSKNVSWLVASNRQPPIEPGYLDLVLCMFGFPQYQAFAQCTKAGGSLVLIEAGPDHLIELRERIYETIKPAREFDHVPAIQAGYKRVTEVRAKPITIRLDAVQLQQLLLMTPHFFRAKAEAKEHLAQLNELEVTLDLVARTYVLEK